MNVFAGEFDVAMWRAWKSGVLARCVRLLRSRFGPVLGLCEYRDFSVVELSNSLFVELLHGYCTIYSIFRELRPYLRSVDWQAPYASRAPLHVLPNSDTMDPPPFYDD